MKWSKAQALKNDDLMTIIKEQEAMSHLAIYTQEEHTVNFKDSMKFSFSFP